MKFSKKIILLLICLLPLFATVKAQSSRVEKRKKELEKRKEQKTQETLEQYQKAVKAHNDEQSKDTQKRMKRNLKKSQRLASGRKGFFLKRWFTRKRK